MKSFVNELATFALSLSERDHKVFSSPLQWVILANGDADFHDNVIFFGFDEKRTDPVLVAKVPRLIENGWMLRQNMSTWSNCGIALAKKQRITFPDPMQ